MPIVRYKSGNNWVVGSTIGSVATTSTYGFVRLASSGDIDAGTDDGSVVTAKLIHDYSDSNFVHRTDDEEISGTKTFKNSPTLSTTSYSSFYLSKLTGEMGSIPENNLAGGITTVDSNGLEVGNQFCGILSTGNTRCGLFLYAPNPISTATDQIYIECDANGNFTTHTPTPEASNATSNNTNITNVEWVNDPSKSTNVVHRTGDEEISGTKTFIGISSLLAPIDIAVSYDVDEHPETTQYCRLINVKDDEGNQVGNINSGFTTSGQYTMCMESHRVVDGVDKWATIRTFLNEDGTSYATAPTPSSPSDNSTKIATTAWVSSKIQFVNSLPANPESGVLYLIPE